MWRGAAWLLLAAALCLSASVPAQTRDDPARLPAALEDAELDEDGVTLTFAEPMQVWENRVETDRLQLTPSLPTSCSWASDTELSCSFGADHKPRRATRYRGALAAGLVTRSGRTLGALRFEVDHARPELRAWIEGWGAGRPRIWLDLEADVDLASLQQALRLEIGGRRYPVLLAPADAQAADDAPQDGEDRRYRLRLPALPRTAAVELLSLHVEPGLRSRAGPLTGIQSGRLLHALDREPFRLRAAECNGPTRVRRVEIAVSDTGLPEAAARTALGPCVPAEPLRLVFSRMPTAADRAALAERLPPGLRLRGWAQDHYGKGPDDVSWPPAAVAVVEIVDPDSGFELALDGLSAPVASALDIAAGTASAEDAAAAADALIPVRLSLRSGPQRPRLEASGSQVLLADPQALRRHAQAVNAPAAVLETLQVAAGIERGTLALPDSRGRRLAVDAPASEAALADGGWVRWTADLPARAEPRSLEWAAPQFDLLAVGSRDEVLVWARGWDDGRPLAGAEVELLRLGAAGGPDTVAARARTGADGVARLPLPARANNGEKDSEQGSDDSQERWLIRAAGSGQARAVLPLRHAGGWNALQRHAPPELKLWGVSDRPLYRAGETLHYRLWWRQPAAGLLALPAQPMAPRRLVLVADSDRRTVLQWRLTPDAEAGADGALPLPQHLTDGTYCIREEDNLWNGGVCVYVGSFRTQDLWLKAQAARGLLRPGEVFDVALTGGYYSGGVAAGVALEEVDITLQPQSPAAVYPAFADYRFLAGQDEDEAPLPTPADLPATLDADGRARLRIALPSLPDAADAADTGAFGTLRLSAAIRPAGSDSVAAEPVEAVFATAARYVGLRLQPDWPDADEPLSLAAVVIDAEGRTIAGEAVRVEVEFIPDTDTDGDATAGDPEAGQPAAAPKAERVASCSLRSGAAEQTATACRVPRTRTGRYRFTAQADGAAPAQLERYVWAGDGRARAQAELVLERAPQAAGEPVRLRLQQPHPRATVLLAMEAGGVFLDVRTVKVGAGQARIALPLPARARGVAQLRVHAWVAADGASADAAQSAPLPGMRRPGTVSALTAVVPLPPAPIADSVQMAFEGDGASATPGAQAWLVLRNPSAVAQRVTLSVQDDGLRALAAAFLDKADPNGAHWLGDPQDDWESRPWSFGFAQWASQASALGAAARLLWPWPEAKAAYGPEPAGTQAVRNQGFLAVDGPGWQAAAAPMGGSGDELDSMTLDQVRVTGSAVQAQPVPVAAPNLAPGRRDSRDVQAQAPDTTAASDPRASRPPTLSAGAAAALAARLRERFVDTALWQPALALAPGQVLRIPLTLPDNLTRWRALAWSSGADGGFALTEATREAGLPLEVRLQAPVRLYPGDRAVLAANVRQIGRAATEVVASIAVRATDTTDANGTAANGTAGTGAAGDPRARWRDERTLTLAAGGQAATTLEIAPQTAARLQVEARAGGAIDGQNGGDALGAVIEVAPATLTARKRQAGWLQPRPHTLALPALPEGATAPELQLSLLPGSEGLIRHWTADLRDYPHRCWEQILSRAVAAALAIERGAAPAQADAAPKPAADAAPGPAAAQHRDDAWPDAAAAVREALDNVAVFQRGDGSFRYFTDSGSSLYVDEDDASASVRYLPLTAYSLQALRLLRSLGHPVSEEVLQAAGEHLDEQVSELTSQWLEAGDEEEGDEAAIDRVTKSAAQPDLTRVALALGSGVAPDAGAVEVLWAVWPRLPLTGRLALARALAEASDARAGEAVDRLLKTAPKRGDARRLAQDADAGRWMQSGQSLQCELIALLRAHPALGDAALRRSLLAGLTDLYAGGAPAVDTYTGATCLAALRGLENETADAQLRARLQTRQGVEQVELQLAAGSASDAAAGATAGPADPSRHVFTLDPAAAAGARLRLDARLQGDAPVGYVAELRYVEDIARAQASALGFSLERRYAVFRDGDWQPLDLSTPGAATPRAGDWVRITLVLRNARERYFVAITDAVPGGLRPAHLMLGGQAGLALQRVSDTGDEWFATRRLDARAPKFYAEWLPAGTHAVHYFARAANAGDYLAAPAQAELMYGETAHARTAAARLRITGAQAERDAEGDGGR